MNEELKIIKKIYGEEMMHLCRAMFPTILEKEGLLFSILQKNLAPTHSFAKDIKEKNLYSEFKNWILSFVENEKEKLIIVDKSPFQLMDEAGYILYECKSEDDIQKFRKYYAKREELCTFTNGNRLERCYVFFAVKKNVDEIKRKNFKNPKRQDEYGTSVISIQFAKYGQNTLSIKNRYNHRVFNPDATFGNNLENIIPGLTQAFEKHYELNIYQELKKSSFLTRELNYARGSDGKYYRYNLEMGNVYYCENNIIISHGNVIYKYALNKERFILFERYIIDKKEKIIFKYTSSDDIIFSKSDSFLKSITELGKIIKIDEVRIDDGKMIIIYYSDNICIKIGIDKNNALIFYENNYVRQIGDNFLCNNNSIKYIGLSNVRGIGIDFMYHNKTLSQINIPLVELINRGFLANNYSLKELEIPNIKFIGTKFMFHNYNISYKINQQIKQREKSSKQLKKIR